MIDIYSIVFLVLASVCILTLCTLSIISFIEDMKINMAFWEDREKLKKARESLDKKMRGEE